MALPLLLRRFVFLLAASAVLAGCASNQPAPGELTNRTEAAGTSPNKVSTLPFNRPEKYEFEGPFGSMLNNR